MTDLTAVIVKELTSRGFQVLGANSRQPNLQAYCVTGHDHNTASLSIRRDDGRFYCFGCGIKGRSWNALAKIIGAAELTEDDLPDPFSIFAEDLRKQTEAENVTISLPWDLTPWEGDWRGLSESFLRKCQAQRWYDEPLRCRRILLPAYVNGILKGWTARRLDKKDEMKYRNAPKMQAREILYPYDVVSKYLRKELSTSKTMVLVEGQVDALRLVYHRIPAQAILGTNNYDPGNKLLLMNLGVERVIVAMDGDEAGKKARYAIEPDLQEWFVVDHFFPPWGDDPGGMPDKQVKKLKKQVFG